VRGVRMYAARLDDAHTIVICEATRVAGDEGTALYEFELSAAGSTLIRGRATVVLDAGEPRVLGWSP
jgi:predicted hotdog family 3-hydroxylacyl-ACP dehydratase